jgi:hypothetical protein
VEDAGEKTWRTVSRAFEIQHVKLASGPEHAMSFAKHAFSFSTGQVVEHKRGEHAIEGVLGIGQSIGKSLIKLDREFGMCRFALCTRQSFWIRIKSNDCGFRMKPLDHHGQRTRTAAHFEDTMSGTEIGLIYKCSPRGVSAEQLHNGVIEWQ